jgi:hypothetical protein
VRLVFDTFRRTESALGVVRHFSTEGIVWPQRIRKGARAGELVSSDWHIASRCHYIYQAMASIPRTDARVSSFAAGPLGIFSPRSHLLTTPTVTFK